jgi:hypothetical protein
MLNWLEIPSGTIFRQVIAPLFLIRPPTLKKLPATPLNDQFVCENISHDE